MNKKLVFVLITLVLVSTMGLSAKSIGLDLDIGGVYTRHIQHTIGSTPDGAGFYHHSAHHKNLGGFSLGLSYHLPKNWSVYVSSLFTFYRTFVNDTQIGFGYTFNMYKGINLFVGGGFAMGGSVSKYSDIRSEHYFNIGGGLNLVSSYMFSSRIGMFLGLSTACYKPVSGKSKINNLTADLNTKSLMHQSFNLQLGLRVRF